MHCKHIGPVYIKKKTKTSKYWRWTPTETLCTYICNFPQTTSCVLLETLERNMLTFLFMYIKYVWNIYSIFILIQVQYGSFGLKHFKELAYLRVLLSFPLA